MRSLFFCVLALALCLCVSLSTAHAAACDRPGYTQKNVTPDECPVFHVDGVEIDFICTEQEFKEHVFMDALVTNISGTPIASYKMVVALYDADGTLLASRRVERVAREGMLDPGCSQDERFVIVNVRPDAVARVEVMPVPR